MAKQPLENVVQHLFQIAAQAEFKILNDQELLKRYIEHHDELAFGELVRRYKSMVWCICWHVLRHQQDVEDAFQATIMTLVRRAKSVLGRETMEGWLHATAFKVAKTAKRDQGRQRARAERSALMRGKNYDNDDPQRELNEVLNRELIHIPEKYRSPLLLCYLEGLTQKEAAQRLGITVDALDRRLRQGRDRLKTRLNRHGMEWGPTMLMGSLVPGLQTPAVPTGLVERTIEMARILMQSNAALEAAGMSAEVAVLTKSALGMTLKGKLLLGTMLLSLAVVTAGVAKYTGILHLSQGAQRQAGKSEVLNQIPVKSEAEKTPPRVDYNGDPLPKGALARLGTERFRKIKQSETHAEVVFTPDSKAVGFLALGDVPRLWDVPTGKLVHQLGDSLHGQPHVSCRRPVSPDGRWYAYRASESARPEEKKQPGIYIRETTTGKLIRHFKDGTEAGFAIAPDSQALLAVFQDHKLCLCDIATGQRRWQQLVKEKILDTLRSVVFSPDGKMIAIGVDRDIHGPDAAERMGYIELRDAHTGRTLHLLGHPWAVEQLSFASDARTLAVIYKSEEEHYRSVYAWDVTSGKERWHLNHKQHDYKLPSFSPDGKILAMCDGQEKIGLWEAATGKEIRQCQRGVINFGGVEVYGSPLTFAPNGAMLAVVQGSLICCWEVATGKFMDYPQRGHESAVLSVAFSGDGKTLTSGGGNEAMHSWDSCTGKLLHTLREESRRRDTTVLSNSSAGFGLFRSPTTVSLNGKVVAGRCLDLPPDKKWYWSEEAIKSIRSNIHICDAVTGRQIHTIDLGPPATIYSLALTKLVLSPDGKFLAAWQQIVKDFRTHNTVWLWDVHSGKQVMDKLEAAQPEFSPDGKLLLAYKDETLGFWQTATGKKVASLQGIKGAVGEFESVFQQVALAADGQTLATISKGNNASKGVKKINVHPLYWSHGSEVRLGLPYSFACPTQQNNNWAPSAMVLSPDGKMLALAWTDEGDGGVSKSSTVCVCETATGKELARFTGHSDYIESLAFSPDGCRLASGSRDTTILVWDVTGGRLDELGHLRPAPISAQEVEQFWGDLASSDAVRATRAVWTLTAAPQQTVPFFKKHLAPIAVDKSLSAQRIERLIADLDNPKYAVRKKAMTELNKHSEANEAVAPALYQALEKKPSLEMRRRLLELLASMETRHTKEPTADMVRVTRAIEVLQRIGSGEARQVLQKLAQGASGSRQTLEAQRALCTLRLAKQP